MAFFSIAQSLVPLVFVALVGLVLAKMLRDKQRAANELQAWANARGLHVMPPDPRLAGWVASITGLSGSGHTTTRLVRDADGGTFGEIEWNTGGTYSRGPTHRRSFSCVPVGGDFPLLQLLPAAGLTPRGVQSEWAEFNTAFTVASVDDAYGHAVLSGPMQEWLMANVRGPHVALVGGTVVIVTPAFSVTDYDVHRRVAHGFAERIRPFVWQRYGGVTGPLTTRSELPPSTPQR